MFGPVAFAPSVPAAMVVTPTWSVAPGGSPNFGVSLVSYSGRPAQTFLEWRTKIGALAYTPWAAVDPTPREVVAASVYNPGTLVIVELRLTSSLTGANSALVQYTWTA